MNRWKVAGARPRKYGLLVIAAQLLMGFLAPAATYTITVYSNVAVTGKPGVVDSVNKLLTDFPRAAISVSSLKQSNSQPSSTELASTNAFIIYAAGSRSYFDTEGLATNPAKLSALASWITAGGSLILADGADTTNSVASNSFISLINALLGPGQEAGCKAAAFDLTTRIFRRFDPPSVFGFLPVKNFRYQQGDTFSALACRSGLPIYSSNATQKMFSRAAALTWGLGKGAITWTGANILTNPNGPIALVVAAAVIVEPLALPPPPPPPPSPQRPPPRRSPPPSPPPPPPPVRSPPPPPPVRSPPPPPPVRSPPPPPPVRFPPPPPPVRSPPPPPPVRFPPLPPPVRSPPPPPPVRSPPPPPPVRSPPPSPPVRSPPPSPPVRSPPPLPVRAPPPPSIFSRPAPPPPPPPRGRLPSSPPVGSPPSNKPSTGRRRPPPPPYEAPPPYMDYGPPPLI